MPFVLTVLSPFLAVLSSTEGSTTLLDSTVIEGLFSIGKQIIGICTTPPLNVFVILGVIGGVVGVIGGIFAFVGARRRAR